MSTTWSQHLRNELRRSLYMARRYWVEALLGLGLTFSLFGGLLFAVLQASDSSLDSGKVDGLIAGFAVWLFAQSAFGSIKGDIVEETEQRTLEQLSLGPRRLGYLLGVRALITLATSLLLMLGTLLLAQWWTEGRVQLHATVLLCALAGAPALLGVSYALAGLTLLIKKGEILFMATFPLLMGLVALPAYPMDLSSLLPYALSAAAARAAATGTELSLLVWGAIGLNSLLYLLVGRWGFNRLLHQARQRGVLGHF